MFTDKERVLANEASLTASLLGNGLNALKKRIFITRASITRRSFPCPLG